MSVSTSPPPAPPKKRGGGCCGCGCSILVLLVILLLALMGGLIYLGYSNALKITSDTAADVPSFDGGDDVFNATEQKLNGFSHDVQNRLAATMQLSADEINTLIAHDPDFAKNKIKLYVSLTDDRARVQTSIPTDVISDGLVKGRYVNGDTSFGLNFDADAKALNLDLKSMQVGAVVAPENDLPFIQTDANAALTQILNSDPHYKDILSQAASVQIKNGLLVIQTK